MKVFGSANRLRSKIASAAPTPPPADRDRAVADVLDSAERSIDAVVAAAEAASTSIRADVRRHLGTTPGAPRIDRQQLVAELGESLAERTEDLRKEAAELAAILGRARQGLAPRRAGRSTPTAAPLSSPSTEAVTAEPAPTQPAPAQGAPAETPRQPRPFAARQPSRTGGAVGGQPGPEAATAIRLLATQMAVAGSGRTEIETRLQSEFGVEDPSAIVADVLEKATESEGR